MAFAAFDDPFQDTHVLAKARPQKLAIVAGAEPVDGKDARRVGDFFAHGQPVPEIVGHVVAAERQHGERIAAHFADLAGGGGGGFRSHGGGQINTEVPVEGFVNQRHHVGAAAAENEGGDGHALGVFPGRVERRALVRRRGKAGVGMRRLAAGLLADFRRPRLAGPVGQAGRRFLAHALPPDIAIGSQRHIGEDDVFFHGRHGVEVGGFRGARRDAKIPGLRIDGVEVAILTGLDPGDVVADGGDLPAIQRLRRDQHGEVGLAAGGREGSRHVVLLPFRRFDAEDQHVLRQPAFVARHVGGDAQRETFLAEQGIAAVAGAVGPDFPRLGKMHDVFGVFVAGPRHVLLPGAKRHADRMQAGNEGAVRAEHIQHRTAHAGHDAHVHRHIGRIADLHADVGDVRAERAHAEGHHV